MNDKHTPGFYRIELYRAKCAYTDMRTALLNAEKLNETAPEKMVSSLAQVQNDHLGVILDYIIANDNFSDSDNDIVQDAIYALDQQQQNIGLFQRIRNFFKTR